MGRQIRKVPENWQHPVDEDGDYIPLLLGFVDDAYSMLALYEEYSDHPAQLSGVIEYHGEFPNPSDYVDFYYGSDRTHYQYYESTTEGTPISPVFATVRELAQWIVDNQGRGDLDSTIASLEWALEENGGSL